MEINRQVINAVGDLPDIKNDGRMNVYLSGDHFQQNKVIIPNNDNVIIFIAYMKYNLYRHVEILLLLYKMLYLELRKLLKILILQNIIIKDMVYVLMKKVLLVIE